MPLLLDALHQSESKARPEYAREFLRIREQDQEDAVVGPALANALLEDAFRHNATDIHVDPGGEHYRIRFRIDGGLVNVAAGDAQEGQRLINQFKVLCEIDPSENRFVEGQWTGDVGGQSIDLRSTFVSTVHGDKLCARMLPQDRPDLSLENIISSPHQLSTVRDWLSSPSGMLVVAGPTGSGKTTLLFALANELNTPESSIVTLEDPVEMMIPEMTQIDLGNNGTSMTCVEGVRASLRLDPDFLLIGETRDAETARAAVAVANTGRSLLTTLHSEDSAGVITNMRYWGVDNREIANAVSLIIAVRLVRRLCERCKDKKTIKDVDRRWLESHGWDLPETTWYPIGCESCLGTGFRGRFGIQTTWKLTPEQSMRICDDMPVEKIAQAQPGLMSEAMNHVTAGATSISELRSSGLPRSSSENPAVG